MSRAASTVAVEWLSAGHRYPTITNVRESGSRNAEWKKKKKKCDTRRITPFGTCSKTVQMTSHIILSTIRCGMFFFLTYHFSRVRWPRIFLGSPHTTFFTRMYKVVLAEVLRFFFFFKPSCVLCFCPYHRLVSVYRYCVISIPKVYIVKYRDPTTLDWNRVYMIKHRYIFCEFPPFWYACRIDSLTCIFCFKL